ncbi:MAG: right-handed parallel beta-helix repeat-containing protein, partial [Candidatus Anstonellales archaeon]
MQKFDCFNHYNSAKLNFMFILIIFLLSTNFLFSPFTDEPQRPGDWTNLGGDHNQTFTSPARAPFLRKIYAVINFPNTIGYLRVWNGLLFVEGHSNANAVYVYNISNLTQYTDGRTIDHLNATILKWTGGGSGGTDAKRIFIGYNGSYNDSLLYNPSIMYAINGTNLTPLDLTAFGGSLEGDYAAIGRGDSVVALAWAKNMSVIKTAFVQATNLAGSGIVPYPIIYNKTIYASGYADSIYAYAFNDSDPNNITLVLKWYNISIDVTIKTLAYDKINNRNLLIVNSVGAGTIYALNPDNGNIIWVFNITNLTGYVGGSAGQGGLDIEKGIMYGVHQQNRTVFALNLSNGNVIWWRYLNNIGGSILSLPLLTRDFLYVVEGTSDSGIAYALNPSDGSIFSALPIPGGIISGGLFPYIAVTDKLLFLSTTELGKVYVIGDDPISDCMDITESGSYVVRVDLIDKPHEICINVTVSDVFIDGNGKIVDSDGVNGKWGVYVQPGLKNVIIEGMNLTDWVNAGIGVQDSNNTIVRDNYVNNSNYGIYISGINDSKVVNNTIYNAKTSGIYITGSILSGATQNNTIANNTIYNASNYGIEVDLDNLLGVYRNIIENNTIETIINNDSSIFPAGIYLHDGGYDWNIIRRNTVNNVKGNSSAQIKAAGIYGKSINNQIINDNIIQNISSFDNSPVAGLILVTSSNNNMSNNTVKPIN